MGKTDGRSRAVERRAAFSVVRLSRGDILCVGFCFVAPVCQSVACHFPGRAALVIDRDVSAAFL